MQELMVDQLSSSDHYARENDFHQYASVEISKACTPFCYHFKLWRLDQGAMCILVKEDSEIISKLKEGDQMSMKYYGGDTFPDSEFRETSIQLIQKADNGRFKGHYLVYLEILH
jgi:hypothetical protein